VSEEIRFVEIPVSVYLTITAVGSAALFAVSFTSPLRQWWRAAKSQWRFSLTICAIWVLLLWPGDPGESFAAGAELGVARVARVAIYILLFVSFTLYRLRVPARPSPASFRLYLAYIAVCFISVSYSPSALESAWKSFELLTTLLVATVWLRDARRSADDAAQIVNALCYFSFATVLYAVVGLALYPQIAYGIQEGIGDIATAEASGIVPRLNANTLGQVAGIMVVLGIVSWIDGARKKGSWIVVLVGGVALIAAHSRTSLLTVPLVLLCFFVARRRYKTLFFVAPILVVTAVLSSSAVEGYFTRGQDLATLKSMTGRTQMWAIAWDAFTETPWLGKGFYTGHKSLGLGELVGGSSFSSVDNTFLEALVDVGLVGTIFLLAFAVSVFVSSIRALRWRAPQFSGGGWERLASFVFITFILIRSMTGPTLQTLHINLSMMFACAAALAAWRDGPQTHVKSRRQPAGRRAGVPLYRSPWVQP
jgi:O-antigen ligase